MIMFSGGLITLWAMIFPDCTLPADPLESTLGFTRLGDFRLTYGQTP